MLPTYMLSRYNARFSNGALYQWLNNSVKWCSSSDSSDSDSDTEKIKHNIYTKKKNSDNKLKNVQDNVTQQRTSSKLVKEIDEIPMEDNLKKQESIQKTKITTESINLMEYITNMMKVRKLQKTVDIAMPKKKSTDRSEKNEKKYMSSEKKLISAAKDVAAMLGEDQTRTTSDLIQKILSHETKSMKDRHRTDIDNIKSDKSRKSIKLKKDAKSKQLPEYEKEGSFTNKKYSAQKSVVQTLLEEYKQSIKKTSRTKRQGIDLWNGNSTCIFENMSVTSPNTPELKTWTILEQRELKALTTYPPANIFQELILWTEQGKLWKFPIDNEYGMEEEHNVHFSEHVFMERHLKGWCPKAGPIRHFMELVCNGLSKNPYMTVQEKIDHIMWYKEYFKSKEDLLQQLGAIQKSSDNAKQITK